MAVDKDNHIDPNIKARWGFAGEEGDITVGPQTVGETGGVDHARTRTGEGAARKTGGGAESSVEVLQLDAVTKLAEGLEKGVLIEPEGEGPALRVHQALSGLQESMTRLASERDANAEKAADLQKQVDELQLQAEQSKVAQAESLDDLTIAQLKERLDAKTIPYKASDSKPELLALLKGAQ